MTDAQDRGIPGIDYLDDCADEAIAVCPAMAAQCVDCAFKAGTNANQTPLTRLHATTCVEARHPFFCHKVTDRLGDVTHLCAGWMTAIRQAPEKRHD